MEDTTQTQEELRKISKNLILPDRIWKYFREKIKNPGVQKHSKNIGWMFFGRIGGMVISFIATAYIARGLGPMNYGQLSYAISYVGLFGFLASLGIDQILYRDLIKFPHRRNEYMGSALVIRLTASIFAVLICTLSALLLSSKDVSLLLIFIVSLGFIFGGFQLLSYEFQAEAKAKYPSFVSLGVVLTLNVLKILVITYGKGIIFLALVILIEPILYGVGLIYFRVKEYGTIKNWKFDAQVAKSILKDSIPLIFASAFFAIYARIDQVMIKHMINSESVGIYDAAVRISELFYFIPNIIVGALFPAVMNSKKASEELYILRTRRLFFLTVGVSFFTACITSIFSKYFILIIFGSEFIGALSVLQIYIWSNIGAALNLFTQQLLIGENLTKIVSITVFLGTVVNVILNLFLIPKLGISGAAYASLVSYLVPFFSLILFKSSKTLFVRILRK